MCCCYFLPDESVREACGFTIQAMNQYSPDLLKAHSAMVLPLVFLAMHDKKETGQLVAFQKN